MRLLGFLLQAIGAVLSASPLALRTLAAQLDLDYAPAERAASAVMATRRKAA